MELKHPFLLTVTALRLRPSQLSSTDAPLGSVLTSTTYPGDVDVVVTDRLRPATRCRIQFSGEPLRGPRWNGTDLTESSKSLNSVDRPSGQPIEELFVRGVRFLKKTMGKTLSFLVILAGLLVSAQPLESQEFPVTGGNAYQVFLRTIYDRLERFAALSQPSKMTFLADGSDGGGDGSGTGTGGTGDGGNGGTDGTGGDGGTDGGTDGTDGGESDSASNGAADAAAATSDAAAAASDDAATAAAAATSDDAAAAATTTDAAAVAATATTTTDNADPDTPTAEPTTLAQAPTTDPSTIAAPTTDPANPAVSNPTDPTNPSVSPELSATRTPRPSIPVEAPLPPISVVPA
jgi:hypothetical protein